MSHTSDENRIRTIPELLEHLRGYDRRPALRFENRVCSYGELVFNAVRKADLIRRLDLAPGSHLGLPCRNTPETLELLLAIPAAGHVAVLLPGEPMHSGFPDLCRKMNLAGIFGIDLSTASAGEQEMPPVDAGPDTEAVIFLTSGTTGQPKGVIHTHGSLMETVYSAFAYVKDFAPYSTVTLLPMHHVFGAVTALLHLFSGSFIHMDTDVRNIVSDLPQIRPDFILAVPGLMETIFALSRLQGPGYLASVRVAACGGAAVPESLVRKARDAGIRFLKGYGMTETGGFTAVNTEAASDPVPVGKLCEGMEAKIVDGELLVRGRNVMKGYYNDPEENAKAMPDGWLRTGDLAEFDSRGQLYITGRKKKLITLENGENVSPAELEELLKQFPEIRDCRITETEVAGHFVIGAEILPDMDGIRTQHEELRVILENAVDRFNAQLPEYKKIRVWTLMKGDLSETKCWKN